MTKHAATIALVLAVTAGGTLAHGTITGRWSAQTAKAELVMPAVPLEIGDWKGEDQKSGLADDKHLKNMTRRYTHKSGRVVSVSLTLGPAGLTSQHTPEYCYPGSGFQAVGQTGTTTIGADGFRTAVFRKDAVAGSDGLRIYWAWTTDGKWSAPKIPELSFIGNAPLFKVYVVTGDVDQLPDQDAEMTGFIQQLLAAIPASAFAAR